jgi:hypothetical protein
MLGGSSAGLDALGEEINLLLLPGIEQRLLDCPAHCLVTISITLWGAVLYM